MSTESQQRRTPCNPQQLPCRHALANADLQMGGEKMLMFDGVMHVKTLI